MLTKIEAARQLTGVNWNMLNGVMYQAEEPGVAKVEMPSDAAIEEVLKADPTAYKEKRRLQYPSLKQFADAYVHEKNGNSEPMKKYLDKCNEVKKRFPKPNAI